MVKEILIQNKTRIIDKWIQLTLDTYSSESTKFLKAEKNQFGNPVGFTITNNLEKIFNEIIGDQNFDIIESSLLEIVKIRAIQDFTPSKAVGFVLLLNKVIWDELKAKITDEKFLQQYMVFSTIVDRVSLIAFDLYMNCREKIFQVRVKEMKSNLNRN